MYYILINDNTFITDEELNRVLNLNESILYKNEIGTQLICFKKEDTAKSVFDSLLKYSELYYYADKSLYTVEKIFITLFDRVLENKMVNYCDGTSVYSMFESNDLNSEFLKGYGFNAIKVTLDKPVDVVNTEDAKAKINDLVITGDPDTWVLICKASSKSQGWMKSTKAMEVFGAGVVIQVTNENKTGVSEALTFIPGVKIDQNKQIVKI